MYTKVIKIEIDRARRSKHTTKRLIVFKCDVCNTEFTRKYSSHYLNRVMTSFHFCSTQCSGDARRKGGELMLKIHGNRDHKEWHRNLQETLLARHGVTNPGQMNDHTKKVRSTLRERYGEHVTCAMMIPGISQQACKKRHETMKRNGSYTRSSPEDRLYEKLVERFPRTERQKIVNDRWPIDFYVPELDVYVQVDGVYWHGLDRSIEEIKASNTKRDQTILGKIECDERQNQWFKEHNLVLWRFTDQHTPDHIIEELERNSSIPERSADQDSFSQRHR